MAASTATDRAVAAEESKPWLPIGLDMAVMVSIILAFYSATVYRLLRDDSGGLWSQGEHSHGPIMLAMSLWLLVNRWRESGATDSINSAPGRWLSWPVMALALALFVSGRSLGIIYFEVGSFIPMLMALVLLFGGLPLLSRLKFPVFFAIFMVPLPGFLLDPISHFVKLHISAAVSELLWFFGYPITHTGVVINIGPYQLLVADACAGMRTLFMLEAMGIFYLNVFRHSSWVRNVGLAMLIVPISFVANMIRVIVLTLITYHFGDEAGQGFLHGFAGMVLFLSAMFLMISIDTVLRTLAARYWPESHHGVGQC